MASGAVFAFGPYQLDTRSRRLLSNGSPVALSDRQLDVLHALVASAGSVVPKERLIEVGWPGTFVGDSSLEKVIFQLRKRLDPADPNRYIKTAARRGYQLLEPTTQLEPPKADVDIHAVLAPYRAWIEGRAALETLECRRFSDARIKFEEVVRHHPNQVLCHIGLANACALQFETTRAELEPDVDALRVAEVHAREAFRLNPDLAETSATLGFVLGLARTGHRLEAGAALQRAVELEPDNWRHLVRQSAGNWGDVRYRTARRALAVYPDLPMAHWLAATVKVAFSGPAAAERELQPAVATLVTDPQGPSRFSPVGICWLKGLLCWARDADAEAMVAVERELAFEHLGFLYSKECCAHAWYAIGARHLRRGDDAAARAAFLEAITRVPRHLMAHAGLEILARLNGASRMIVDNWIPDGVAPQPGDDRPVTFDLPVARAALLVAVGDTAAAVRLVAAALAAAPPGNAGWLIPIDPLLGVSRAPGAWTTVLQQLRDRAR